MKKLIIIALSIWALISVFWIYSLKKGPVVAKIQNEKIYQSTINDILYQKYFSTVIDDIVNSELLKKKAQDEKIDISKHSNKLFLTESEQDELIKQILQKTTSEAELKKFYEEINQENVIKVRMYYIDHQTSMQFMEMYERNKNHEEIEHHLSIPADKISDKSIKNLDSIYKQVQDLQEGDIKMIMEGHEHSLVLVTGILSEKKEAYNGMKRDEILNQFILEKFKVKKINLLNELKEEYEYEIKQ